MRRRAIRTSIRWVAAFVKVTLHTCTPALAADVGPLGVVTTPPRDDAGSTLRRRITRPGDFTRRAVMVDEHRPDKLNVASPLFQVKQVHSVVRLRPCRPSAA
jgi:hypothetical protein